MLCSNEISFTTSDHSLLLMKIFWNWIVVIVTQLYKFTKSHWIIHLWLVNFTLFKLYFNKAVTNKNELTSGFKSHKHIHFPQTFFSHWANHLLSIFFFLFKFPLKFYLCYNPLRIIRQGTPKPTNGLDDSAHKRFNHVVPYLYCPFIKSTEQRQPKLC